MKKIVPALLMLVSVCLTAQEKKEISVKTEAKAVTIFMKGAQVTRKKSVELSAGKSTIKFTELSPYIDEKSIQIKVGNDVVVLSVSKQLNYTDTVSNKKNMQELNTKLVALEDKAYIENATLDVIKEEVDFLKENRMIGGKSQDVNLTNLKQTADYYHERLLALKTKEMESNKKVRALAVEIDAIKDQMNQDGVVEKKEPIGEIVVKVDVKNATNCEFELQYVVENASWYPTYDIRSKNISEPIELRYKANIRQNTKEEWKNVQLKLSSSNPNSGSVAPELRTYFLSYNYRAPVYSTTTEIKGIVIDAKTHETLPGVTILIEGTTIATSTDINGNFSITRSANGKNLVFSSIGYKTHTLPIESSFMNVYLQTDSKMLSETVVTAYGVSREKRSLGYATQEISGDAFEGASGVSVLRGATSTKNLKPVSMPEVNQIETPTSVDFDIKMPYTINSDNKNTTVDIDMYALPASYEYYCVPKIDKDAFLIASVLDWEKYNLLAGEANIFFENTFVGKSILDVDNISDTLKISLGRDKNISVKREKIKDYTTRQFIGSKKEETRDWQISVKNNKKETVNMQVYDQVPVSTNEEIEVITDKLSGAELNKESGEVKWKFKLESTAKKEFELKYKVKYPKERNLVIQ
ncbi:MAG TPA: mucoidy inhibitor MuiA family protein [Bacteroidia bacterium]|nr:mucoidy inhibitor MuiA family protein [Bacteroidia bacterium]